MIPLRVYTVRFAASAQTGVVDWFELQAGSGVGLALLGLFISQTTEAGDTQDEMIGWKVTRASGSYTSGSGGNTSVARNAVQSSNSVTAAFTAETLNTTQVAAGSGTLTIVHDDSFNVRAGLALFWTPETALSCKASEALAVGMDASPADSITWKGTAYVADLL